MKSLVSKQALILAVTWTLTGLSAKPELAATFLPALFIAVTGVAIPLYLLQAGIKHTEPITAAIVPSLRRRPHTCCSFRPGG